MQEFAYHRPVTVAELKEKLSLPGARLLAGGTDIIPRMHLGKFTAPVLVDTSGIKSLRSIEEQGQQVVLGALTTHQDLADSDLIRRLNPALAAAAASIGCIQTRCRGTLGGNIANASPAADTVPPLLIVDAALQLQSQAGERTLPLEDFLVGPGKADLMPGEFIHSILFSPLAGKWGTAFSKLGRRSGMAVAVVNAAAAVILDDAGLVQDVRIAVGSVAPVVLRCRQAERFLAGNKPDESAISRTAELCQAEVEPISDIRSSKEYRLQAVGVLVRRTLVRAVASAEGRE